VCASVEAGGDTSPVLEAVEHALDLVARLVPFRAVLDWYVAVFAPADRGFDAETVRGFAERVANMTSVRDHQYAAFRLRR
jgi:hypothetical protein